MNRFSVILALLLLSISAAGVNAGTDDSTQVVDTLLFDQTDIISGASPVDNPENFEEHLYQNPTVALFKSMVIPGLGQLGNRRRVKAAFFFGLDVWMIGAAIHYGRQASDFKSQFDATSDIDARRDLYGLYLDRKDERNKYTWFAVIVSFLSMFDAYVDAHLSGHPAEKHNLDLSLDVVPADDGTLLVSLSLEF